MSRINQVSIVLGRRGSGKTTYIKKLIANYGKKHPGQKILVLDTLDHPAYREIPNIDIDLMSRWIRPNTYRIYGGNTDEILQAVDKNLTNALVVMEDASKYLNRTITPEVRRFIYDSKQKNLDIIFLFHGFMSCPPELFRMVDNLVLFKTGDTPESRKRDLMNYNEVLTSYNSVIKNLNPYYNETIKIY